MEPSSLEGWLAVKKETFKEDAKTKSTKPKGVFLVVWNAKENKFAVTFNEKSRMKSDVCSGSHSRLFSSKELYFALCDLQHLCPDLEPYFPKFPEHCVTLASSLWGYAGSLWSYVGHSWEPSVEEMDSVAESVARYLSITYDRCAYLTILGALFDNEFDFDVYYENLSEMKHKSFLEKLEASADRLDRLLKTRAADRCMYKKVQNGKQRSSNCDLYTNFDQNEQLLLHYLSELEAIIQQRLEHFAEYYTYLRQPFLDIRELSMEQQRSADAILQNTDLGDRRKTEQTKKKAQLLHDFSDADDNIMNLDLEYYRETTALLKKWTDALKTESLALRRLNASVASRVAVTSAICTAEQLVALESISFCNSDIVCLKAEKMKLLKKFESLESSPTWKAQLDKNEPVLYALQKRILDRKLELLKHRCNYLKLQLSPNDNHIVVPATISEHDVSEKINSTEMDVDIVNEDQDQFFDAAETVDVLDMAASTYFDTNDDALKSKELRAGVSEIFKKISSLRVQNVALESQFKKGQFLKTLAQREKNTSLNKLLVMKDDEEKQENAEKLKQRRETTLQRLRSYKNVKGSLNGTSGLSHVPGVKFGPPSIVSRKTEVNNNVSKPKSSPLQEKQRHSPSPPLPAPSPLCNSVRKTSTSPLKDNQRRSSSPTELPRAPQSPLSMGDSSGNVRPSVPPPPAPPPPPPLPANFSSCIRPPALLPPPPPPPPLLCSINTTAIMKLAPTAATLSAKDSVALKKATAQGGCGGREMIDLTSIVNARKGLRKVVQDPVETSKSSATAQCSDGPASLLHAYLERMKAATQDSDSEDAHFEDEDMDDNDYDDSFE